MHHIPSLIVFRTFSRYFPCVAQVFLQWLFCALEVLLETILLNGTNKKMKRGDMDINSQEGCDDGGSMSEKLPINRN